MERRKISIYHATSNASTIEIYVGTSYLSGQLDENGNFNFIWHRQQETNSNTTSSVSKNRRFPILMNLLMLFFAFIWSFDLSHSFLLSGLISFYFPIVVWLLCFCICEYFLFSNSFKSNHSAEHMIVEFINEHQRLPISLEEFKKTSRLAKDCGSFDSLKKLAHFYPSYFIGYLLLYVIFLLFYNIGSTEKIITSLILCFIIIISVIFYRKKAYLINYFIQLFNTTTQVTDDSLYLAYLVAWLWLKEVYPEYSNEYWMQSSEILNQISKIEYQDSQETSL